MGSLMVRCPECMDLFGTEVAHEVGEGREAVMPDGRPIRSVALIAKDRAECISSEEL